MFLKVQVRPTFLKVQVLKVPSMFLQVQLRPMFRKVQVRPSRSRSSSSACARFRVACESPCMWIAWPVNSENAENSENALRSSMSPACEEAVRRKEAGRKKASLKEAWLLVTWTWFLPGWLCLRDAVFEWRKGTGGINQ